MLPAGEIKLIQLHDDLTDRRTDADGHRHRLKPLCKAGLNKQSIICLLCSFIAHAVSLYVTFRPCLTISFMSNLSTFSKTARFGVTF